MATLSIPPFLVFLTSKKFLSFSDTLKQKSDFKA